MEFQAQLAIYLQIAHQMAERIIAGEWPPGHRIPSSRDLAADIEVNPNTVMRAYAFLQDEAIIVNQRGVGFFVAEQGVEKAKALKKAIFLRELLPQLMRHMELLNISWEELQTYYFTLKQQSSAP
jgi:GntR family transcriptional regulator